MVHILNFKRALDPVPEGRSWFIILPLSYLNGPVPILLVSVLLFEGVLADIVKPPVIKNMEKGFGFNSKLVSCHYMVLLLWDIGPMDLQRHHIFSTMSVALNG